MKINRSICFFCVLLTMLCFGLDLSAQERVPLWPVTKKPNCKGLDIKDSVANGRVYMVNEPWMEHFVPEKPVSAQAPAVLIIPGGGYARLAYEVSGNMLAHWFNAMGIHAFVLYHRLPISPDVYVPETVPLQDGQRAMRYIRSMASKWGIDSQKVGAMGCSAGGHLASTLATHDDDVSTITDAFDELSFRPDFTILVSPVISMDWAVTHKGSRQNLLGANADDEDLAKEYSNDLRVDDQTPPALLIHADNDPAVSPLNSIRYYMAMREHKRPASLHIFPQGGHNISLEPQPGSTQQWSVIAEAWLREMDILPQE